MSIFIGITSYRPDNEKIRKIRTKSANTQLEFLHEVFPDVRPVVVAQNYKSEDEYNPLADYIKYEKGIGPGAARNVLLEKFYASDADYILLCDDDIIVYPYYHSVDFMHHIAEHPEDFVGVDSIIPHFPMYLPFKKTIASDAMNLTHYKFIPRNKREGAQFNFLRNIVKDGYEPVYFNPDITALGDGREDVEFNLDWIIKGHTSYCLQTLIAKDLGGILNSSIYGEIENVHDTLPINQQNLTHVVERFGKYGLKFSDPAKYVVDWKGFSAIYDKSLNPCYVKRLEPIELSEKELPKGMEEQPINLGSKVSLF